MSQIRINITQIKVAEDSINCARREASSAQTGIKATARYISPQIRRRNQLEQRIQNVTALVGQIERKMERIQRVVTNGASSYLRVENESKRAAMRMVSVRQNKSDTKKNKNRNSFK